MLGLGWGFAQEDRVCRIRDIEDHETPCQIGDVREIAFDRDVDTVAQVRPVPAGSCGKIGVRNVEDPKPKVVIRNIGMGSRNRDRARKKWSVGLT